MLTASTALTNTLKQSYAVKALPRLIAEWNQNRYAGIQTINNTPAEETDGYDTEVFPLSSVVEPNRPTKGLAKLRVSSAANPNEGIISDGYQDAPNATRYYITDEKDLYKYWSSPVASTTTVSTGKFGFAKTIQPYVIYKTLSWVNKIVIGFETSSVTPNDWDLQISLNGTTWTTVATNPTINSAGQAIIYRQANGIWNTTAYREAPLQIKGLRIVVRTINKLDAFLSLIEMSPRLESDLTPFVIEYDSDFTMSEPSFVTPLGRASSNTASVELSNIDGRFNNDNVSSLYYNIIDKNVKMTLDLLYDSTAYAGSAQESVRQFTMYADNWQGQGEEALTVELKDSSKFLQEIKTIPVLYEQMTIGGIVWRLCDLVGFNNYKYQKIDDDAGTIVPYFWTSAESTIWDVFSQLAERTQSAIYFDEFDVMQIQTRDTAYNMNKAVDWTFDAGINGTKLPDIIELTETNDYEANSVNIKYKTTKISEEQNGFPVMEVVWQPEDTMVLRSSALMMSTAAASTVLRLDPKDAATWPYQGIFQIEGEFIRYYGKGYYYYNKLGQQVHTYIKSDDAKKNVDNNLSSDALKFKNAYSGYFVMTKRGEWNTQPVAHSVDTAGWVKRYHGLNNAPVNVPWAYGFTHNKADSTVTMATNSNFATNLIYVASRNYQADSPSGHFGTRFKFQNSGYTHGCAGIAAWLGTNNQGYYIDVSRTVVVGNRANQHEINLIAKYSNGTFKRFGPNGGRGVPMAIDRNIWYDLDVQVTYNSNTTHTIKVMLNGVVRFSVTLSGSQRVTPSGQHGIFVRGFTRADFEYFFATAGTEPLIWDAEGFFDKVSGGYVSGQWDREWTYLYRTAYKIINKRRVGYLQRYYNRFFDEFGPIAHEVRELDITFDKGPVVHSNLYMSNDYQVICPEYVSDAFSAQFIIANTARVNAVINGEDTLSFGIDNPVDQKIMIYGRLVQQEDEKSHIVSDDDAIRRRGKVELEIQSDWIQSEDSARNLGEWIIKHWGGGNDEVALEIFGNPLIQIGDKVAINYQTIGFAAGTHKYFVVAKRCNFSEGFTTTLTLRRVKS